jgi:hypothetical protein
LVARLRILRAVLAEAWPAWLAIGGVVAAVVIGRLLASTPEAEVRIAGMLLQLLGLGTVAVGLSQIRRLFGRPSVVERLTGWFKRVTFIFGRRKDANVYVHAATGGVTLAGSARVRIGASPDAPIERRLAILEENVNHLQKEVDEDVNELRGRIAQVRSQIDRETQERRADDRLTASRLEDVAIGGLHLESIGLLWLVLGVMGTSVPQEIAAWVGQLR